jgi:hypothetical protein
MLVGFIGLLLCFALVSLLYDVMRYAGFMPSRGRSA